MINSVPITFDKDYELRFDPEDVEACEAEIKMGYVFFFRVENQTPLFLGLTLCKSLIHHGLKVKDSKGDLLYAIPQGPQGAKQAAQLIQQYTQRGDPLIDIWMKCREAFELGWFAAPKEGAAAVPVPTSKNSHGTGSNRRNR